jgi:hypothetical protein
MYILIAQLDGAVLLTRFVPYQRGQALWQIRRSAHIILFLATGVGAVLAGQKLTPGRRANQVTTLVTITNSDYKVTTTTTRDLPEPISKS